MSLGNSQNFRHDFALKLLLEVDGKKAELLAGNIEKISLDLHSYGFTSTILFTGMDNEELNTLFNLEKAIKTTLTFSSTDPKKSSGPPLLELKGIVVKRRFRRVDQANDGTDKSFRYYYIVIHDAGRVTWSNHFPINIYVDTSMREVLEDHKNPEITIKYDFPALEQKHPITAFCLPYNHWLPKEKEDKQISFYSFLNWYLHQDGGILAYDYQAHSYAILGKKEEGKGEPYKIPESNIFPPEGVLPSQLRSNSKIIKHSSDASDAENINNETAFKSVRSDSFDNANYRTFPELAFEKIESPLNPKMAEIELVPTYFDADFNIDKLVPGAFVSFKSDKKSWTGDPFYKDKVFRSRCLIFEAKKIENPDTHKPIQKYQIVTTAILEFKDEVYIERPRFSRPVFPFEIHGKVFSKGDNEQTTYTISEGEKAPQGEYLVKVPLAGDDKKVVVPFFPNLKSGQFYYPYQRDEKVLLAMYFRTAQILRSLDWQPHARLPGGVQGNQNVLGSNGKDKFAIIKHIFDDSKNSVVTILLSSSATQTQTIIIKDKEILISVEEKDKKTVLIRFNSDEGIFLSLNDKASGMIQEFVMDGKQMSLTCKDKSDTSTLVQKPGSFTFSAKEFNILAEKVKFEAKETIDCKAPSKMNIETSVVDVKGKLKASG